MLKLQNVLKELEEQGYDKRDFVNLDENFDPKYVEEMFKEDFPVSYAAIQKLNDDRIFICRTDCEGADFAVGRYSTMKGWCYQVLEWATMDEYADTKDNDDPLSIAVFSLMNEFKPETIIDLIQDVWQIQIEEVDPDPTMDAGNLEELLKAVGSKKPLNKNGKISEDGWDGYRQLRKILKFLDDQNIIEFNEDKLDDWIDDVNNSDI